MTSLFAALGVAVSGLSAQSQSIGNISTDLANAQTTGYKAIGTNFEDLVTASSATNNNPGGVTATPSYQNDVQGNIATTSTTTNLAISGQGFFEVSSAAQSATGATEFTGTYYTRDGDFTQNTDGYLVNSAGYYLEGYTINSEGVVDTSQTVPVQISSLLDNPVPTTQVTYAANLPAGSPTSYTSTASTVQVYDSLGQTAQMSLTWTSTGTNEWNVTVDVAGGAGASDLIVTVPVTFNTNGTIQAIGAGGTGTYTVDSNSQDEAGIGLVANFTGSDAQDIDLNFGTLNASNGVTQYANASSTVSVTSISQNGLGEGSFSSIGIDTSGIVSINYTNGTTKAIYQIPIANFNSPDNLQNVTGGVYSATLASGAANLYLAGTNGAGTVASGSLESSNVDIAGEFTTMIEAQQIYSANAKVVTAVNSMLNTIIQAVQG